MGTRSDIIVHRTDGKWHRIYCHWDGYLDHAGRILFDHYTSQAQAEALVALGDLSSLAESPAKPAGHSFDNRVKGYCVAYGRDRGEKDVAGLIADTLPGCWPEEGTWTEFTYVWTDGRWLVGDPDEGSQALFDLGDVLAGKKMIQPAIKAFGCVIGKHRAHDPGPPKDEPSGAPMLFVAPVVYRAAGRRARR